MAFDEAMPRSIYAYPGFVATYENCNANGQSMFNKGGGILFHGSEAALYLDREGYRVVPEGKGGRQTAVRSTSSGNDLLECVRSRRRPANDIEKCFRSKFTCLLGKVALRSRMRLDWDAERETIVQPEGVKWMSRPERDPWKIVV